MPSVRIQLLGGLQVSIDGKPARGLYEHVRAVLGYLCAEPERPIHRDTLAQLLWPDEPERVARRNFRQALSRLRLVLGDPEAEEPLLLLSPGVVQLNPRHGCFIDLEEFLAHGARLGRRSGAELAPAELPWLESALALYRGPFLDQFYLSDNPSFDQWLLTKREGYQQRALGYLRLLADHYQAVGDAQRTVALVQRQIEIEPWNEQAHRRLMQLHALAGQRAAALAQYNVCKTILWDELGVEPDAATTELRDRIAGGEELRPLQAPAVSAAAAERRHVTVLCCGMNAPDQDPEPMIELDAWLGVRCGELSHEFQAHRDSQRTGLHYLVFGFPAAHEDDAVRAVLAANRLLAAARAAQTDAQLQVGIQSGLVAVADADGGLLGPPLQAAALLRFSAPAGTVAVGAEAARLVQRDFAMRSLEGMPILSYTPLRSRSLRAVSLSGRRRSGFFGRADVLAKLRAAWQRARGGKGACVLLSAEPGMGKSRVVQVLRRHLAHEAPAIYQLRCQPRYQASSLQPVAELLHRLCGVRPEEPAEEKRRRLETLLRDGGFDPCAGVELLGGLLVGQDEAPAKADPGRQQRAVELAAELQLREAERRPTLWILEDLHWADPSTAAMARHMLSRLAGRPLLMVLTARPGTDPGRVDGPLTRIELPPLSPQEARRLARGVAGERELPPGLLDQIVARAEGVPLFVRELTEAALESDGEASLPSTLQDSLAARLDALGPAKRVAQLAAVIGREFDRALLFALDGRLEAECEADLLTLVAADVVQPAEEGGGERFSFRHALLQEAAHDSLLQRQRQEHHGRLADLLAAQRAAGAPIRPEWIAPHCAAAQRWVEAIELYLLAGQAAQRRAAHEEAISHYRAGLALVPRLAEGVERDRLELALQLGLGMPLMFLLGPVPEMEQAYARAIALSERMPASADLFAPLRGLYTFYLGRANFGPAFQLAEQLLRIARAQRRDDLSAEAFRSQGVVLLLRGEIDAAARHFQHVLLLEETCELPDVAAQLGLHPARVSRALLAVAAAVAGLSDQAVAHTEAAVALARQDGHSITLGIVLNLSLAALELTGRLQDLARQAEELHALAERQPMPVWSLWSRIMGERARALLANDLSALEALLPLFERHDQLGPEMGRPYCDKLWADTCLRLGRHDQGLARVELALARARERDAWLHVPALRLLRGELRWRLGQSPEEDLRAAVEQAGRTGAALYQRQALERLADWRAEQGEANEAARLRELALELKADLDS